MGRRNPGHGINPTTLLLIILLIGAIVYLAATLSKVQPVAPVGSAPASLPAQVATELTSDDRIIFWGMPRAKRPDIAFTVLKNKAYIVGYSEERRDPLWSAYRVVHMEHPFVLKRPTGEFITDTRTAARVAHHDFTGSGYDRGHMTPNSAIARGFGEEAQHETFLLSNICPQSPALNEKVWEKLERDEIEYADRFDEVWVIDGPIFPDVTGGVTKTLRSGIAIPAAFYKILIENHAGGPRVFAVIMPQMVKGTELPQQYLTSIEKIENETQLEFLWKLDPGVQRGLKSTVNPMW